METVQIAVLILLIAILAILVYVYFIRKEKKEGGEGLLMLQQQLQELTRTMDERMGETADKMYASLKDQTSRSQELIRDINKEVNSQLMNVVKGVAEVSESSKQVFTVAEQLQNLEKVLKHQ